MKLLREIDRKQGVNRNGKAILREAVRGVIIKDRLLLMIYSSIGGGYKFPGGGVNKGETYAIALIREIKEECGAKVISIGDALGKVIEYDIPKEEDYDVFKMTSYYFLCEVDSAFGEQSLDQYEEDLGFTPVWIDIDKAIGENKTLIASKNFQSWTPRETFMLEYIKESLLELIFQLT